MERSKPTALLIFVAILSLYVEEGCCLYCLSCTGISQPRHCHILQQCNSGQRCALVKFIDQFGDVYYDVGCMDAQQCQANHTLTHGMQCLGCCDKDMCNSNLCGAPGYPNQTGSVCFSCTSMPRGRQCRNIEFCQENEVCFRREYEEFGDMLIDTGCSTLQGCKTLKSESNFNPGTIVGKRSGAPRSLTHINCSNCCAQHICNDVCYARDCLELKTILPSARTGPYNITMRNGMKVMVWCDMTTDGGGWTVFQKRYDGSVDFYRSFAEYTNGFGSIDGEFWLGLENIYELTVGLSNSLRVDTVEFNGTSLYAQLSSFFIDAGPAYTLHVGGNTMGSAGSEMIQYDGKKFTTKDNDQDTYSSGNCAEQFHGAFWYMGGCFYFANPNSRYSPGSSSYGHMTFNNKYGLKSIQMKFRRNG